MNLAEVLNFIDWKIYSIVHHPLVEYYFSGIALLGSKLTFWTPLFIILIFFQLPKVKNRVIANIFFLLGTHIWCLQISEKISTLLVRPSPKFHLSGMEVLDVSFPDSSMAIMVGVITYLSWTLSENPIILRRISRLAIVVFALFRMINNDSFLFDILGGLILGGIIGGLCVWLFDKTREFVTKKKKTNGL